MDTPKKNRPVAELVSLQWGHALSGMDTLRSKVHNDSPSNMLQWGHALSGMDTLPTCGWLKIFAKLQWGHALSGMDTHGAVAAQRDASDASMGPCPFRHGYTARHSCRISVAMGFNGAMPFQTWILRIATNVAASSTELQWGHALSGMDMSIHTNPRCWP